MKLNITDIQSNIKKNPFYKETDPNLVKEVQIKAHIKSETPYIPIGDIALQEVSEEIFKKRKED